MRRVILLMLLAIMSSSAIAESVYSSKSLKTLCKDDEPDKNFQCKLYLHGVVETWMLKEADRKDKSRVPFCKTILSVSDDEWLRIVRRQLDSMEEGFAAGHVMSALTSQLCK